MIYSPKSVLGFAGGRRGFAHADGLAAAAAGAGVRLRALSAGGQAAAMPVAAVAADLGQALDVRRRLAAQLAFDPVLLGQKGVDQTDLLLGEVLDPDFGLDHAAQLLHDLFRAGLAHSMEVAQSHIDPLVLGKVDSSHTRHTLF